MQKKNCWKLYSFHFSFEECRRHEAPDCEDVNVTAKNRSPSTTESTMSNRPTTATSVIERLNIEKVQNGDGVTICGGVFVTTHCYVILLVMSGVFTVVGAILTAISYRPRQFGEELERFLKREVSPNSLKVCWCTARSNIYDSFIVLVCVGVKPN